MNIKQIYPSPWLNVDDLQGRRFELVISDWKLEELRNPQGQTEQKLTIGFRGAKKRLVANKTQPFAIAQVTGCDDTDQWPGKKIALRPGRAHNGKPTIVIEAPAVEQPSEHLNGHQAPAVSQPPDYLIVEGHLPTTHADNPFEG